MYMHTQIQRSQYISLQSEVHHEEGQGYIYNIVPR